jgi:hypothetical protein
LIERKIRLLKLNLPIVGGDNPPWLMLRRFYRVCHRFRARPWSPALMAARIAGLARGRAPASDRLAACLKDPRAPEKVVHRLAEIIRFRMLMIAAGYEGGNDADTLRRDAMFKLALDRLPSDEELCSQSTISRLENLPDVRALLRLGRALIEQYCAWFRRVPKCIVLDIDDTFDRVHGGQQLRLFNAFHDAAHGTLSNWRLHPSPIERDCPSVM